MLGVVFMDHRPRIKCLQSFWIAAARKREGVLMFLAAMDLKMEGRTVALLEVSALGMN